MKKGKKFEEATYSVIKELRPTDSVYKNVFIQGLLSKKRRQVDIKLVNPNEYDFLAFECKNHTRPLDIPVVEAFNTKLKDIGAKKGALVSNSPYTPGAVNIAKALDIDLLGIVDTSDSTINTKLCIPTLLTDIQLKHYSFSFSTTSAMGQGVSLSPKEIIIINETGQRTNGVNLVSYLWNCDSLIKEKGEYVYTPPNPNKKKILSIDGQEILLDNLSIYYEVVERNFYGPLGAKETAGIFDVHSQSYQTKRLLTEELAPHIVEKTWKEISTEEARHINSTIHTVCSSVYPTTL